MNRPFLLIVFLASVFLQVGCRARQLQRDQDRMRVAVMDMYTNQIMDNLVRAHNGYPFVQMQYGAITGTIDQKGNGEFDGSFPENVYKFLFGAEQANQLTVTANPIIDNDAVYLAYVAFALDPEKFICTAEPPPQGADHICVCCDKMYYWVPADKSQDFLNLALSTSVMSKGGGIKIPDGYTVTVIDLLDLDDEKQVHLDSGAVEELKQKRRKTDPSFEAEFSVKVQFEDYVPASDGTMLAKVDDKTFPFRLNRIERTSKSGIGATDEGKPTRFLKLTWNQGEIPVAPADLRNALKGQIVKVTIPKHPPGFGTTGDVLEAIQHEMQLFRLNQRLFR